MLTGFARIVKYAKHENAPEVERGSVASKLSGGEYLEPIEIVEG